LSRGKGLARGARYRATACSVLCSVLLASPASDLCAQGYVSKGKDGEQIYSNRPPDGAATSPVLASPSGTDVTTYVLTGPTLEDVQKDAALKAPIDPATGARVGTNTTWSAGWNYWTRQEGNACRIDVVSVRLKVATQLPAWTPPKDVASIDQCRWDALSKALRNKEEARASLAFRRGRELEHAILSLPPHPRCDGFAAEVAALGQKFSDDGKPRPATAAAPALPVRGATLPGMPAPAALPPKIPPGMAAPGVITPGAQARVAQARPMPKAMPKPGPPLPPKPLPIAKSIYDACKS
jgi:predicted secreted Zn-dependent protease